VRDKPYSLLFYTLMKLFVTAIGTDSGKTFVSALLCEIMGAQYWKPIQAGSPTDTIMGLVSSPAVTAWPEANRLKAPMSPHAAAAQEGLLINIDQIKMPDTKAHMVVEGAGGILVPVNDSAFVIDLAQQWDLPIVLVANLYLGSINHTLLSASELKRRGAKVLGIVFNGPANVASEKIILHHTGYQKLFSVTQLPILNKLVVSQLANELRPAVLPKLLASQ
jgi:dethiobiotin synthetase